ncbi:MAG: preprotein translocase subunit SecG [Oscillospiraceae bacterium]|nr:preprotein translocase subunit SecG [Oscillospiraceae bacterium]MDE7172378.1 preprotein translocase subunit SecG [Oscillospiraceae bacterium]
MTIPQIVLSIIYFVVALGLIAVVMLQSGKSAGLSGAIAGGADTFLSKNKAKSADARLAKMTKWVAIVFMILTLVLCLLPGVSAAA